MYGLEQVRQIYAGRVVLDIPRMEIDEKSIIGLAGPNGSGKSTLMRILAFVEEPATGTVYFDRKKVDKVGASLRRQATMLNQEPYLLLRSVRANVAYGLKVRGWRNGAAKRVDEALDMVGLAPDAFNNRSWRELSGGEAQRTALAARLACRPRVLLLDEPTASVDKESARRIREASLAARTRWGTTLVVISHDMNWLESVADAVWFMQDGKMAQ